MAARLWAIGLLLELALSAGVGWLSVRAAGAAPAMGAVSALAALGALALAAVGAPLALARAGGREGASREIPRHSLALLAAEALALQLAMSRMALAPLARPGRLAPDCGAQRGPPVLLVHGFACNGAVWRPLLKRLERASIGPTRAVSLEPLLDDIDAQADRLLAPLEAVWRAGGGRPVAIVAHSMGGLVARALLARVPPGRLAAIVTLGTPHHGTVLACSLPWPCARQMCPDSPWLRDLNRAQERRLTVPVSSLYSLDDTLILPPASAALGGARVRELRGVGHLGLLRAPRVLERVVAELARC